MRIGWGGLGLTCFLLVMVTSAFTRSTDRASPAPRSIMVAAQSDSAIAAAVAGGVTVVCRHAMTDDTREREPVDYDDRSTQRLLSAQGERQSAEIGQAMIRSGVRVTELVASPMSRARRTAQLMFDQSVSIDSIWHTNGGSYEGAPLRARERVLATPVGDGVRLIVSHISTIASAIPSARGELAEGDCAVVRAAEGDTAATRSASEAWSYRLVGFVPWRDWLEAAR